MRPRGPSCSTPTQLSTMSTPSKEARQPLGVEADERRLPSFAAPSKAARCAGVNRRATATIG